jgi:hypothetical protein
MQAMERADTFERRALAAREAEIGALIDAGKPAGLAGDAAAPGDAGGAAGTDPAATTPAAPKQTPSAPPTQNRSARGSRRPFGSP